MNGAALLDAMRRRGTVDMDVVTCVTCGVRFGIDADYHVELRDHRGGCKPPEGEDEEDQGAGWHCCTNGHEQRYTERSAKLLGEKVVKLSHRAEQAEAKIVRLERKVKRAEGARDRFKRMVERLKLQKGDDANALQPVACRQAKALPGGNRV